MTKPIDLTDIIPWDDVCFIDCETRSTLPAPDGDIRKTSTTRYAAQAFPIMIRWAYGLDGEIRRWDWMDFSRQPTRDDMPKELLEWGGYFAAMNSAFDRKILDPFFNVGIRGWLDMAAQAAYNNMPLGLDRAAKTCGYEGKIGAGKALISKFCSYDGMSPQDAPGDWERFGEYADVDVIQMQAVAGASFPVPYAIWEEFWVSEWINDRGLPIDINMARGGALVAGLYGEQTNQRVSDISDGDLYSVRQYAAQQEWVWERVRAVPFVADHMVVATRENEETGEIEYKLKMDRPRIEKMIAALQTLDERAGLTDDEYAVLQFLEEREYGASAAPAKFQKMLDMVVDETWLPDQYVFNGATQTGRFSSRGVQVHNMTRSALPLEMETEAAEFLATLSYLTDPGDALATFEDRFGAPAGKPLSRLIRPTIIAPPGKVCVWGDWSNVEARKLPWLAGADKRLDLFRSIDKDPDTPDVYVQAVAKMYGHDLDDLWAKVKAKDAWAKKERMKGKISELALGFGGAYGALQSMAASYGLAFAADEGNEIVERWRSANEWAEEFWDALWAAFIAATSNPDGTMHAVGKIFYQGIYVGGEVWVICYLPDGFPLFYRNVRERKHVIYDEFEPDLVVETQRKLSFESEKGVKWLWRGLLAENITQASCARLLRMSLCYLDQNLPDDIEIAGHTHDEILLLSPDNEDRQTEAKRVLSDAMLQKHECFAGLPLAVDVVSNLWYSKAVE